MQALKEKLCFYGQEHLAQYLEKNQIQEFILLLSSDNNFRRMENKTLAKLLTAYPVIAAPAAINAAPGMPLFSARCRRAVPPAGQ